MFESIKQYMQIYSQWSYYHFPMIMSFIIIDQIDHNTSLNLIPINNQLHNPQERNDQGNNIEQSSCVTINFGYQNF